MSRVPIPYHKQLAVTIANAANKVALHAQQIVTLQSGLAAVVPGDWEDIGLQAGWANQPGYIPAQVRILQNGMSQVIGHIQGGTVSNGTVIGTLTSGYFNTIHAHSFTINAVSGASSVAHPGSLNNTTGTITSASVQVPQNDHTFQVNLPTSNIPTSNHTWNSFPVEIGPGGQQFQNIPTSSTGNVGMGPSSGNQFSNNINGAATGLHDGSTATNVNMNTPTITLDTSGNLTISNVDPNVNVLSFSELIPLVTA